MVTEPDGPEVPRRLRFGVMCRGSTVRAWQAEVLRNLLDVEGVEAALLVEDVRKPPSRGMRDRVRRLASSKVAVWDAYNNGWVGRRAVSLRPVALDAVLPPVPRIEVEVEKKGYSELFPDDAVEAIRSHELDFLLRFAFGIIRGPILEAARFGVWSFHHDDESLYRGSPPAFWEIVDGQSVTGAILQRLTDRLDGGVVLDRGWFATAADSYRKNTDRVHLGCTDWPVRTVRRLRHEGNLDFAEISTSQASVYRPPGNGAAARFLAGQVGRYLWSQAHSVAQADHWELGVVRAPIDRFLDPEFTPVVEWQGAARLGSAYAADPFPLVEGDDISMLYERFDTRRRIGEIWRMRIGDPDSAEPASLPITAHASYPFTFTVDATTYCVPQVAGAGARLFRARNGSWDQFCDVGDGSPVLDPTIFEHDRRWWLFATRPGPWSNTKLFAWWADRLEGPWAPHALNPIKTDVRSARPAGTPFRSGGRLYRPAQDCATGYGAALAICEVVELDPVRFEEYVVRTISPDPGWPYSRGIHTLSQAGGMTLLDARSRVRDVRETAAEVRARLARLRS